MEGVFTFIGAILGEGSGQVVGHLLLVAIIIMWLAFKAVSNLKAVPDGTQNVMEAYLGGVIAMGKDVIGEELSRKYLPLVATIGLFVLVCNLIGIIPGFESPTNNINVTLPLALVVFIYYNYEGIKKQGVVHYFAHFAGPVKALSPLMFPIEVVSHISRIVSLSFRLFGNIKGDDLFLWVLLMLVPWIVPLPGFLLLTFSALLQTFVFMILTYVYLAGAVALEEEHPEKAPEPVVDTLGAV
ncbi:F0F1 ATP synthase subunit A [Nitratifractor salsuginis]|uniref:ATP synthase subunit a n=1 Tax=Nitratifractor salsuginis (strain DSM 16511 / JCM 12458 / E9I37-1) TaxID=749222 RepID=E6X1W3_NITSE|nr:F0F1 ATP synthase subunit A [Nitratifractor salsuginis]ADV45971.1 ATP synthase F0 subcomplex A subunit [Nitratifractor salsuginis DSM 16511]